MSAWINPKNLSPEWNHIIGKDHEWQMSIYNTELRIALVSVVPIDPYWKTGVLLPKTIGETWYGIIVTYDNSIDYGQIKLYIDGAFSASHTVISGLQIANTTYKGSIGGSGEYSDYFFNGAIDDIRIYNRALTESEIQALYSEGN